MPASLAGGASGGRGVWGRVAPRASVGKAEAQRLDGQGGVPC